MMRDPLIITSHAHAHWMGRCGHPDEPRSAVKDAVYRSREATRSEVRAAASLFRTKGKDESDLHYRVDEETDTILAIVTDDENDIWRVISCCLLSYAMAEYLDNRRFIKKVIRNSKVRRKKLWLTDDEYRWLSEGRAGVRDEI